MRLKHQDPASLIGETEIFRGRHLCVDRVAGSDVVAIEHASREELVLSRDQWGSCILFPSSELVRTQYRRLLSVLCVTCTLTRGEAEMLITGYLAHGHSFMGAEAVARIGGASGAFKQALTHRTRARRSMKGWAAVFTAGASAI